MKFLKASLREVFWCCLLLALSGCYLKSEVTHPGPDILTLSAPSPGVYKELSALSFTVEYQSAVTVSGSPQLKLAIGNEVRYANYISGSDSTTLIFQYVVEANLESTAGVQILSLDLNGGSVVDKNGQAASVDLPSLETSQVIVDSKPPDAPYSLAPASDYVASLSQTPVLNWSDSIDSGTGLDHYLVRVKRSSDSSVVADWQNLSIGSFLTGLGLAKGEHYYCEVKAIDKASNTSSFVSSVNWTATTPLTLNFSSPISVLTGESLTLTPSEGESPYSMTSTTSGYFNTGTGVYTVPLDVATRTEGITVSDSVGQALSVQMKVKKFEEKKSYNLASSLVSQSTRSYSLAINSSGDLFQAGHSTDRGGYSIGILRKSSDHGNTWTVLDTYRLTENFNTIFTGVAIDVFGNIFTLALAYDSSYVYHWVVRKSSDEGANWSTVDNFTYHSGEDSIPNKLITNSSGELYVVGSASSSGESHWIVRKSSDGGTTWTNSDDYSTGHGATAYHSAVNSSGHIFVVGTSADASHSHWIVRKSTNGGASWSTVDDFNYSPGELSEAWSIGIDNSNAIYVLGKGNSGGAENFIVRKSLDGGANWTTIYHEVLTSHPRTIAFSPNTGNIYAGLWLSSTPGESWTVRKSTDGGNTWTQVDHYDLDPVGPISMIRDLKFDQNNNLYAAGFSEDSSSLAHAILRKSSDEGTTWMTINDFQNQVGSTAIGYSLAQSPSGDIYASGLANNSSGLGKLVVLKSSDQGQAWSKVDEFTLDSAHNTASVSLAVDSNNRVFVGGYGQDASNVLHWIVRSSTNGGLTWTTQRDYNYATGKASASYGLISPQNNLLYTVGNGTDSSNVSHWIVEKSTNGGSSWVNISDYFYAAGKNATAYAITVNSSGHIFVVGQATDSSNNPRWIVRKSEDDGAHWTDLDDYYLVLGKAVFPKSIALNSSGHIFVAGYATDSSNVSHWIVRRSTNGGTSWTTVKDYNIASNKNAYARSLIIDTSGYIYVSGRADDSSGYSHWVVQKSRDNGATWYVVENKPSLSTSALVPSDAKAISLCGEESVCAVGSAHFDLNQNLTFHIRKLSP